MKVSFSACSSCANSVYMNSIGEVRNSCPLLENIESDVNSDPQDSKLSFSLHSYRHIEPGVCFHLQFLSECWF